MKLGSFQKMKSIGLAFKRNARCTYSSRVSGSGKAHSGTSSRTLLLRNEDAMNLLKKYNFVQFDRIICCVAN